VTATDRQPNTPENREKANARVRALTRAAIIAASGATVFVGVVVARDHPGAAASHDGSAGTSASGKTTGGSSSSADSGSVGDGFSTGSTGSTGNTGSTGSSPAPSATSSRPSVTSGGTS